MRTPIKPAESNADTQYKRTEHSLFPFRRANRNTSLTPQRTTMDIQPHFDHEEQFNYILECAMTDRQNFKQLEVTNMTLNKKIKSLESTVESLTQAKDFQNQIIISLVEEYKVNNLAQVIESLNIDNKANPHDNGYDTVDTKRTPHTSNKK